MLTTYPNKVTDEFKEWIKTIEKALENKEILST
jgi:hypothetical protein